jgi:hypothetical protein
MGSIAPPAITLAQLAAVLEVSWRPDTAHLGVAETGNPALGQCYPTSWVVQRFFPGFEIVRGLVDTGGGSETHFWNLDASVSPPKRIDLSWQQFARGSRIIAFEVLDRDRPGDTPGTVARCERLLARVLSALATTSN